MIYSCAHFLQCIKEKQNVSAEEALPNQIISFRLLGFATSYLPEYRHNQEDETGSTKADPK